VDRGHDEVSGLAPRNVKRRKKREGKGREASNLDERLVILPIIYLCQKNVQNNKIKLLN
jgi:hypothetical protein